MSVAHGRQPLALSPSECRKPIYMQQLRRATFLPACKSSPGWFVVFKVSQPAAPSPLKFLLALLTSSIKRHNGMICVRQIRNTCIFLGLNSQMGTGTPLNVLLSGVKGRFGAVTSSNPRLFVPVLHQSATVKAKHCRRLDFLHPADPPTTTIGLNFFKNFKFSLLCL